MEEGELEIGQVSALVKAILPAEKILQEIWEEFREVLQNPVE
jgi:enoyl-[acyl-carrier protein] reductase II